MCSKCSIKVDTVNCKELKKMIKIYYTTILNSKSAFFS